MDAEAAAGQGRPRPAPFFIPEILEMQTANQQHPQQLQQRQHLDQHTMPADDQRHTTDTILEQDGMPDAGEHFRLAMYTDRGKQLRRGECEA